MMPAFARLLPQRRRQPAAPGLHGDGLSLPEALAALDARESPAPPAGSHPYAGSATAGEALATLQAREVPAPLAAPVFTRRPPAPPSAKTRPQVVLREPGRTVTRKPPEHVPQAMSVLRRVRDSLARGTTPVGDRVAAEHVPAPRPLPQVTARRAAATEARLAPHYPPPGGDYSDLMATVDRITRTTGLRQRREAAA